MFEIIREWFKPKPCEPKIVRIKTKEEQILESHGFLSTPQNLVDDLFETNAFKRVSVEDNLLGVFSKRYLFDHTPPEEEFSGIVIVAIVKLPFHSDFLDYELGDRPCYTGEVIYKGKNESDEQAVQRSLLGQGNLLGIIQTLDDEKHWSAWSLARSAMHKEVVIRDLVA